MIDARMPLILSGFAMRIARPTILFLLILAGAPTAGRAEPFPGVAAAKGKAGTGPLHQRLVAG